MFCCEHILAESEFVSSIEKRLTSPLLEPASVQKVMEIDTHIGAAVSGTHLLYR